jgi:hypothetical protein
MKKFHNFALPVALAALLSILPDVASAARNGGSSLVESSYVSVVHKPKKQSTGSWKKNKAKHHGVAKQRKEKKWHRKESTIGQKSFSPKKYRK